MRNSKGRKVGEEGYFRLKIATALGVPLEELPECGAYDSIALKRHINEMWQFIDGVCTKKGLRLEHLEVPYRIYKAILLDRLSRMAV